MNPETARLLIELNRRFYHQFGAEFSATRQRIQPGVRSLLTSHIQPHDSILDLGCGNGEFARILAQTPFAGAYCGLDFSLPLLADADPQPQRFPVQFRAQDLTQPFWGVSPGFSLVTAFAVLHHIPSHPLRLQFVRQALALLAPGGKFILSNWQFLNSPRLRSRLQPWQKANLQPSDVDEGDYLLDWRRGGEGLRYAHHFSSLELAQLAAEAGFRVEESFLSDGEGGNLGLYQVWRAAESHPGDIP